MKLKPIIFATAIVIASQSINAGGLQSQLDGVFGQMTNTTPPGVYESQRRGVLSGGRMTVKNKIFDEAVVGFTPPSWKAGCGGVDLFGGSFSFINAEQLVQLLRSVAANAKGYAFQLALDNVFPEASKHIESFQKKIQAMNQHLGNSCQLAQGLVNDLSSGYDVKNKTDASLTTTSKGLFDDIFSAKQESGGETPIKSLKSNAPADYKKMTGNILWKEMKRNALSSWFRYGDSNLAEQIMSITGTVIIGDMVNDQTGSSSGDQNTNPVITVPGNKINLRDLIEGGSIESYYCPDQEQCYEVKTKQISLKGMRDQILDILKGTSSSPGVIFKYANNSGQLTPQEMAFTSNLPSGMGAIVRNLSILSYDSSVLFVDEAASAIALSISMNLIENFFKAATLSLSSSAAPNSKQALDQISESRKTIRSEYETLKSQHGDISKLLEKYKNIMENTRKQKYMLSTVSVPQGSRN